MFVAQWDILFMTCSITNCNEFHYSALHVLDISAVCFDHTVFFDPNLCFCWVRFQLFSAYKSVCLHFGNLFIF